ncbi:MAG: penicillin acylase family protein, partial [Gemmatimonadota bacterium]
MRKAVTTLGAALALAAVGLAATGLYLRSASPEREGRITVRGLERPVEVWRDSLGVPHIWARSAADMVFAQGWVHAQDRLWQMELLRRTAEGRLAEAMGAGMVGTDRFLRTLGFWRAAARAEAALSPDIRSLLEAYAAGVNAWLDARDGALPPEFLVLDIEPEPWTPRHVLAIEKIMAWDLAAYAKGLSLARAVRRIGPERAAVLFPDTPAVPATILEGPLPPEPPPAAAALLGAASVTHASNAWVVAGERTRSGRPVLANDPHLALRAPSLWYLAALHAEGEAGASDAAAASYDVAGATIPGVPFVVLGHNRAIAWGFTNAMVDDVDFFIERIDPSDSTRYRTPEGSEAFEVIRDTIRVKGEDAGVLHTTRLTRHGPVLTPVEPRAGGELIAMRWAAHDPSPSAAAFAALGRARDWASFDDAIRLFRNPHQNVVYADTAGHIGYRMGGTVWIRGDGRTPPLLPVPGWTGEWDWTRRLPFERHPHALDPPEGYIVAANNRQTTGDVARLIGTDWAPPYRARRIHGMIRSAGRLDADAVRRQQLDRVDLRAADMIEVAIAAAGRAGLDDTADRLARWDLRAAPGSGAAAIFYLWRQS